MAELAQLDKAARQMKTLSQALDSGRLGPVRRLVNTLAPAEIGNLLESLPPAKRQAFLDAKLKETCSGTDKQLAELRKRYKTNKAVTKALSGFDDTIE